MELAALLRARRARLRPADVGLVPDGADSRRRTPGLRREEVAQLSGVGLTWYTWLEQGRDIQASSQVADALARALLLDPDEHQHLRDLAGLTFPERNVPADGLLPRLQRLVDVVTPNVASVYDIHLPAGIYRAMVVRTVAELPAIGNPEIRGREYGKEHRHVIHDHRGEPGAQRRGRASGPGPRPVRRTTRRLPAAAVWAVKEQYPHMRNGGPWRQEDIDDIKVLRRLAAEAGVQP